MKKLLLISGSLILMLTGCATSISQVDSNRYIASKSGGGFSTTVGLLDDLYKEAAEYCKGQGGSFKLLNSRSGYGRRPSAQVLFTCVKENREGKRIEQEDFPSDRYIYDYASENGGQVYLERFSLTKVDAEGKAKFYRVIRLPNPQKFGDDVIANSMRAEYVIDCRANTVKTTKLQIFRSVNGTGAVLHTTFTKSGDYFSQIEENTENAQLRDILCK